MLEFVDFTTALVKDKPEIDEVVIRQYPLERNYYYSDYDRRVKILFDFEEGKESNKLKSVKLAVIKKPKEEKKEKACDLMQTVVVYFDFDKFNLKQSEREKIDEAFKKFKEGKLKVYVSGYTDKVGSKEYNDILAFKRAREVKRYIESKYTKDVCIKKAEGKCCYVSKKDELNRRAEVEIYTECEK